MNAVYALVPILGKNKLGEVHFPCLVVSVSLHHPKVRVPLSLTLLQSWAVTPFLKVQFSTIGILARYN